jgi:hypothetical protein
MQTIPDLSSYNPGQINNTFDENMVRDRGWSESLELFYNQLIKASSLIPVINQLSKDKGVIALSFIYLRSILLGNEIFRLVSGGYPDGAMARVRCLHELVVCAFFMSNMSARKCDPLIGQKYINHEWVRRKALLNEHLAFLKRNEKTADYSRELHEAAKKDLKAVNNKIDEFKKIYGKDFAKSEYGWAYVAIDQYNKITDKKIVKCGSPKTVCCDNNCCETPCCKKLRVNLTDLKNAVGSKDLESIFVLGNHATHAGALPALPLYSPALMQHVISCGSMQIGLSIPIRATSLGLERIIYLTSGNLKDERIKNVWFEHSEIHKKILEATKIAEKRAWTDFEKKIPIDFIGHRLSP